MPRPTWQRPPCSAQGLSKGKHERSQRCWCSRSRGLDARGLSGWQEAVSGEKPEILVLQTCKHQSVCPGNRLHPKCFSGTGLEPVRFLAVSVESTC